MQRKILVTALAVMLAVPLLSHAVSVGPVRLEYTVDPGKSVQGQLYLKNDSSVTQTFYPSFEKFTENNGQKVFSKESSDLATWFRMPASVTLAPDEYQYIPFTIKVPQNAPPGGHFAVIWWSNAPPGGDSSQVAIVTRAGILVYVTVTGNVKETGTIKSFAPTTWFFTDTPLKFALKFQNSGNTYLKPTGVLKLQSLFGGTVAQAPVNDLRANIFPGTDKVFNLEIDPPGPTFGLYHAVVDVTYGSLSTSTASAGAWFIAAPLGILLPIILALILIIFVIPKGLRKYNSWVIKKASGKR